MDSQVVSVCLVSWSFLSTFHCAQEDYGSTERCVHWHFSAPLVRTLFAVEKKMVWERTLLLLLHCNSRGTTTTVLQAPKMQYFWVVKSWLLGLALLIITQLVVFRLFALSVSRPTLWLTFSHRRFVLWCLKLANKKRAAFWSANDPTDWFHLLPVALKSTQEYCWNLYIFLPTQLLNYQIRERKRCF